MNEETLFQQALAKPPDERAAFLDAACGGDAALRCRIDALLEAHEQPGSFLARPVLDPARTVDSLPPGTEAAGAGAETASDRIGPYKLLQKLGEGGMGSVWMAEQQEPVRRRVALKVIKAGLDSAHVLARFEQERQALAMMDHPNIAKVLDAGTTAGRPFFVMELVKGIPITRYCDQEHLTPKERLELFIPVCQAVQHAHQKGIIHRDLKPSNVLIALYDGRPVPKVIDFGVAKATSQRLTERTMFTEVGQIVGTLEYMAPEQAELNNLDIDTRADIYSLGVLLYELLTGSPPFTSKQLRGAAFTEMLRIIREQEPVKPSTRLSGSEELPSIAANRKLEPKKLTRLVHGDLDWIVMKCLEKERHRRYETASGLAADVEHYLGEEPVLAGPPGAGYRLRKFVRRNQGRVVAAALVLLALLTGLAGTTWGLVEAQRQRDAADAARADESRQRQEAVDQRDRALKAEAHALAEEARAKAAAAEASAVLAFFQNQVLTAARPVGYGGLGWNVTIREALDAAEPKIAAGFRDQPLVEASVRIVIGVTYRFLGEAEKAVRQLEQTRALLETRLDPAEERLQITSYELALAYTDARQAERAVPLLEQLLAVHRAERGADQVPTLDKVLRGLARAYLALRKVDQAIPLYEEALAGMKARKGPDHADTLGMTNDLAVAYQTAQQPDRAIALFEQVLAGMKAKGSATHPNTLTVMQNLAGAYLSVGKVDRAIALFEQTLEPRKSVLGPQHPQTIQSMAHLASAYEAAGKRYEALPLLEQVLADQKVRLGPDHAETLTTLYRLGEGYRRVGRYDQAIAVYEQLVQARSRILGPRHADTLYAMGGLAATYHGAGHFDRAIQLFEQTLEGRKAVLGPEHVHTRTSMRDLAGAYQAASLWNRAIPLFEELLADQKARLGPEDAQTLATMMRLAQVYAGANRRLEAVPLLQEILQRRTARLGPEHADTLYSLVWLANILHELGDNQRAEPLYQQLWLARQKNLPTGNRYTIDAENHWGRSLLLLECFVEAERHLLNSHNDLQAARDVPSSWRPIYAAWLLRLYERWGKPDEARHWREQQAVLECEHLARLAAGTGERAESLVRLGRLLLQLQKPAEAETALREALAIRDKQTPDAWSRFHTQSLVGGCLLLQKKYAEAEPLLLQGQAEMEQRVDRIIASDRVYLAEARARLVQLYDAWGKKEKADEWREGSVGLLERTVQGRKARLGETHPDTLQAISELASAYRNTGNLNQAVALRETVLAANEARRGPEHPDTLRSLADLAMACWWAGQLPRASALYEQALERQAATLGADHVDTLATRNSLGSIYRAQGEVERAIPVLRQALEGRAKKLGADHTATLVSMTNLAHAYHDAGNVAEAIPLFTQILEVRKARLGANHIETSQSIGDLASAYRSAGKLEQAVTLREALLASRKAALGPDHEYTLFCQNELALCYLDLGRLDQAAPMAREALAGLQRKHGADSSAAATALATLGRILAKQRHYEEAEKLLRESLAIRRTRQAGNWATAETESLLGEALVGSGRYAEAEPLLLAGYDALQHQARRSLASGSRRLQEAVQRLVQLYETTGQPATAAAWRNKLAQTPSAPAPAKP